MGWKPSCRDLGSNRWVARRATHPTREKRMPIAGRCHCGNIAYALQWPADAVTIPARACGCAFCRKHGNVWTAHPGAALAVTLRDATQVSRYAFETKTADFHVCAIC